MGEGKGGGDLGDYFTASGGKRRIFIIRGDSVGIELFLENLHLT
jgi:hypothetical protein